MEKKYRVGIDLGGTNIKVGVLDEDDKLLGKKSGKTDPYKRDWQEVVKDMAELTGALLAELGIEAGEVLKIGIGSPGMIDHINGVVKFAGNFGWSDIPILAELRRYYDVPMRLSNDANVAALGEAVAGAAKGARHVLLVTLGTGVGGGVISDGHLQEGGSAGAMELGHTLLVRDGEECTCGRKGCLEAYASATGLIRHAREAAEADPQSKMHELCKGDLSNMNGRIPFDAMRLGDAAAKRVVDNYIRDLGEGIINFINIWRPEKILLGGGISNEGDPLLDPLNAYVKPRAFAGERGYVAPIERAVLGNDAGLYGAASL
ncbi:ROK family protein [Ruminococcaceae bacterium OttesenSCG-928-I18]|nr:ROK family protein [Ruminococcaceae bacterium OttesenSCG-928-I18]